jgi:hypothetical protein
MTIDDFTEKFESSIGHFQWILRTEEMEQRLHDEVKTNIVIS